MVKFTGHKLLVATRNPGKIHEIKSFLEPLAPGIHFVSALDLDLPEPAETGFTFQENALIKARAYIQATNTPVIADDSGLCIDALGGFPGIHTATFAKSCGGHEAAGRELAKRLDGKDHRASFHSSVVLMLPDGDYSIFDGIVQGNLVFPGRGDKSWGFDPFFIPKGKDKTWGEMELSEKMAFEHRIIALEKMVKACFG